MPEKKVNKIGLIAAISVFTLLPMGLLGAFLGENNRLSGFAWGMGIGIGLFAVMAVGMFGWEWIKKEAEKGKLLPFLIVGFIVAIAISGFLAINLGNPSCDEYESDPRGSCIRYADDGYEATSDQKWDKFWGTLPVTVIISLLVAYIVHSQTEKKRPKHFKSEQDGFSVSIFPETISVSLDEDGNSYRYSPSYGPKYIIDVTQLDDFASSSHKALEVVESWHRNIVSAAT
jgi:MFS family permease